MTAYRIRACMGGQALDEIINKPINGLKIKISNTYNDKKNFNKTKKEKKK